jgi:hypothetical protein
VGDTLRLRVVVSDPDGDRLTFSATVLLRDYSELNRGLATFEFERAAPR